VLKVWLDFIDDCITNSLPGLTVNSFKQRSAIQHVAKIRAT